MQNPEALKFDRWKPELRNDNFDWWKLATRTGVTQDYSLSMQGGSESLNSFFSIGYYKEQGAVKGFDYQRFNFRSKTNYRPF